MTIIILEEMTIEELNQELLVNPRPLMIDRIRREIQTRQPNNAIQDELPPSEASQTELSMMNSAGQKIKNYSQSS